MPKSEEQWQAEANEFARTIEALEGRLFQARAQLTHDIQERNSLRAKLDRVQSVLNERDTPKTWEVKD